MRQRFQAPAELWIVLFLIMAVVGIVAESPFVLGLGVLGFLVGMVANIWSRLALEDVDFERTLPDKPLFVGDAFEMEYTITNRKPLPMPWLRIVDSIPDSLQMEGARLRRSSAGTGLTLHESTSLASYERVRLRFKATALRRGYHQLGPVHLSSGDLFGLFASESDRRSGDAVLVYPQTVALPDFTLPAGRPVGDARTPVTLWEDPNRPKGLREYQPGDSIRNIDWKVTARLREVMVRTYESTVSQYAVVVVDAATTGTLYEGYSPHLLERVVVGSASLVTRARQLGYRTGLITNSIALNNQARTVIAPAANPHQISAIMEALAMIRPVTLEHIDALLLRQRWAVPYGATVLVISAVMGAGLLDAAETLARAGHRVVAVYVGNGRCPEGTRRVRVMEMGERFDLPVAPPAEPTETTGIGSEPAVVGDAVTG